MVSRFTTSDGRSIAYDDRGTGFPLLCLAGLTRNMADFEPLLEPLAGECRLIRMDYRGRGLSDRESDFGNYNVIREGHDVLELLDHLGLDRVAILGTSRGGLIAMALAAGHRERLAGVILNDIGPEVETRGLARIMGYVGVKPSATTYDAMAAVLESSMEEDFPGVPLSVWREWAERWYVELPGGGLDLRYDPALHKALLQQAATGAIPDVWQFFEALKGLPVAVIRGANSDILTPATVAEMQRRHPGLIAVEVPNRGHVPFLDEPEALAAIRSFLTSCAAQAAQTAEAAQP